MRRPPAPGSDGPEQRSLEDKQPEAFAENPTLSASSEQSPLCSGLFLSATEKQAIRPLPCSSSFAKSPARRACTVASARRAARRRYQLFTSYERPPPASPKCERSLCVRFRAAGHLPACPPWQRARRVLHFDATYGIILCKSIAHNHAGAQGEKRFVGRTHHLESGGWQRCGAQGFCACARPA